MNLDGKHTTRWEWLAEAALEILSGLLDALLTLLL
jgi:hypothetical protein